MTAATFVTRTYTPLAFRESTERRLVASLAIVVAVVWCFVLPLGYVLHDSGGPAVAAQATGPAAHAHG